MINVHKRHIECSYVHACVSLYTDIILNSLWVLDNTLDFKCAITAFIITVDYNRFFSRSASPHVPFSHIHLLLFIYLIILFIHFTYSSFCIFFPQQFVFRKWEN